MVNLPCIPSSATVTTIGLAVTAVSTVLVWHRHQVFAALHGAVAAEPERTESMRQLRELVHSRRAELMSRLVYCDGGDTEEPTALIPERLDTLEQLQPLIDSQDSTNEVLEQWSLVVGKAVANGQFSTIIATCQVLVDFPLLPEHRHASLMMATLGLSSVLSNTQQTIMSVRYQGLLHMYLGLVLQESANGDLTDIATASTHYSLALSLIADDPRLVSVVHLHLGKLYAETCTGNGTSLGTVVGHYKASVRPRAIMEFDSHTM